MKLLKGKTAIVTGANRGIGKSISTILANHGANIAFTYITSKEDAMSLEKELNNLDIKAKSYMSDASSMKDAEELVLNVNKDFESIGEQRGFCPTKSILLLQ